MKGRTMVTARHISEPRQRFRVRFWSPPCSNVFYRPARWRVIDVGAIDEAGALAVARYHWFGGRQFSVV